MSKKRLQGIWDLKYLLIFIVVGIVIIFINLPSTEAWAKVGTVYNCTNCTDCNNAITDASSGNIVQLNKSLSNLAGTCINFDGKDDIIFDCLGNTIDGDGIGANDYGIYLPTSGSDNITIKNCIVTDFTYGLMVYENSDNNSIINVTVNSNTRGVMIYFGNNYRLTNITANSNTDYGIRLWYSNDSILTNIIANSNTNYGIFFGTAEYNNTLINVITNSNDYGIKFAKNNHTLTNITANSNTYGLYLGSASSNTLTNITANNNSQYGIYFS